MIHTILRRALPTSVYTRLGLLREAVGRARFAPYVATHRYGRRELSVHIVDMMGRSWYDHDWVAPAEIRQLAERGRLRECARVFDGAPDVLFVDVEGYELHVLRGARLTLETHRPDLFVEVHTDAGLERFGDADDLLALIPAGYE